MGQSSATLQTYAAFLRGINVGGNRVLKMADVKKAFETLGFRDVKSIGASGNIVFAAPSDNPQALAKEIEQSLHKKFDAPISVILRKLDLLRAMVETEPFQNVKVTPETRLYVTFLDSPKASKSGFAIPYVSPTGIFQIIEATQNEILAIVDLSTGGSTLDSMAFLEKEFGKGLTTRNWNTVKKVAL